MDRDRELLEPHSFFTNMVDELVEYSDQDQELKEGIKWIDEEANKRKITFYEMTFLVLHKYDVDEKAKKWRQEHDC